MLFDAAGVGALKLFEVLPGRRVQAEFRKPLSMRRIGGLGAEPTAWPGRSWPAWTRPTPRPASPQLCSRCSNIWLASYGVFGPCGPARPHDHPRAVLAAQNPSSTSEPIDPTDGSLPPHVDQRPASSPVWRTCAPRSRATALTHNSASIAGNRTAVLPAACCRQQRRLHLEAGLL